MKALKKVLVVAVCAALTLTAMPKIDVQAAEVLSSYNFETMDGMTDAGLGTAPSIVQDAERGNVLQFADGESPTYKTDNDNPRIEGGSPSALLITNPYENSGLKSMTISYWVKVTDSAALESGAALVGWVSDEYTNTHPDFRAEGKEGTTPEKGRFIYGFSAVMSMDVPMINFAGLYHNWYCYWNETKDLADSQWHFITITTDSSHANTKVYVDGVDLEGWSDMGKRWNKGEKDNSNAANCDEPTLMDVITMAGTKLYIGHTGSNPTSSAVYLDDLTFYNSIITDADAMSLYNDAKASVQSGESSVNNDATNQNADNNSGQTVTQQQSNTNKNSGNKTTTPNLPQTGVMSTTALVGIGVAVIGAGAVLLKKKEK